MGASKFGGIEVWGRQSLGASKFGGVKVWGRQSYGGSSFGVVAACLCIIFDPIKFLILKIKISKFPFLEVQILLK